MLFDLTNAPPRIQSYIIKILVENFDIFFIVYLNDIFIYTQSERKAHVDAITWLLDQLQKDWLYAYLKIFWFHQDEVRFLGFMSLINVYDWKKNESMPYIIGLNFSQQVMYKSF